MRYFIFLLAVFSFGENIIYVPKDFKLELINYEIRKYKSLKDIDFNTSLAILSYNDIPFILENNLTVITPIGEVKEYILSHKKLLRDIKVIINVDFLSKILLDSVGSSYKGIDGSLVDFFSKKSDAIVSSENIDNGFYIFPLEEYGLVFNKYFLVGSKLFIRTHFYEVKKINKVFENRFDFRKDLVLKTFLLSSLYLNKKIDFNDLFFERYRCSKNENLLKVDITSMWPPFDMIENGKLYGIGIDFWELIAKKANLKYEYNLKKYWDEVLEDIKNRKADLTINTSITEDRKKYAVFSKPYVSFPLAIICKDGKSFHSIDEIKSIAVGRNFTAEKLMKKYYPNLNYVETKNVYEALELVKNNKAECAVDILPVILWTVNKNHFMNLQIAFKTPFKFNVQIMLRSDKKGLIDKINRAIDNISPKEKEEILNRYLNTIIVEKKSNILLIWLIFIVLILIALIFYVRYKKYVIKAQREAFYDELTRILNRRGVYKKLQKVDKGSVLFFDIDHFKKVNDTYGHEFGDYVLREIGKLLKNTFRKSDIIGRWGGEEFIVILPNTSYIDALKAAEKFRAIVEDYSFDGKEVTISIGVSEYKGDLEESLKKADEALYEAKRNGRNQVKGKV